MVALSPLIATHPYKKLPLFYTKPYHYCSTCSLGKYHCLGYLQKIATTYYCQRFELGYFKDVLTFKKRMHYRLLQTLLFNHNPHPERTMACMFQQNTLDLSEAQSFPFHPPQPGCQLYLKLEMQYISCPLTYLCIFSPFPSRTKSDRHVNAYPCITSPFHCC